MFSKASEGSIDSIQPSKSDKLDGKRSRKMVKESAKTKVGFKDQPSSSKAIDEDDPLALKVTLPSNLSNSDLSVSFEIESARGKTNTKHKKKDKGKMYLTCIRKTDKLSEFEGQLVLPPETDIDKLAKMPLYFVDPNGKPLKSNDDDYTVFQPVKNTLSKNVDIGMKIKDVHLKVKLEKLNLNEKPLKIPKYLSCSFVNASQCPPPPDPKLIFDDDFDFYDDDDEVEEETQEPKKREVKGVSTQSSEEIVSELLQSVVTALPMREPDYVPKKESADSVFPKSSCNTLACSDVCSYYVDSVPQNTPNDRIIQTKVRHEPPSQGDDYYNLNKQLEEDERELLEHQRRVEELDRTLELLQNARTKLTSFLVPGDVVKNTIDPRKVYQLLPMSGVPPVSYLCAAQSLGNTGLSAENVTPMEMVCTQEPSKDHEEMEEDDPSALPIVQCTSLTHGDIPLAEDPSVLIVQAQTKLEEELQKFREKDKSKSNIEIISQHKYLRSIAAVTPKMKLNTIQNLYFSPKFTVEFDAAAYEGLNALYDKRYGSKITQSLASRENDLAYSIVENDIKSMIHDLLKETWTIKETVLENYGGKSKNDDDLISLMEHDLAERESFTNSAFFADHQHGENNSPKEDNRSSKQEASTDFSTNLSTVAFPYQVNYCIIKNPQKSPMVTIHKLNAYHDIVPDENSTGKLEISSGMTNLFDEIHQCNQVQVSADDNISDKKDSGTNETFESQYSKGYNVLVAEMPIDKTRTKFILNTAQIQDLRDDEESINDEYDSEQTSVPSITSRGTLKSPKFADINTTRNICETDTDFAETEINTVSASNAEVMKITSFNSDSMRERLLLNQPLPVVQSCYNQDDETLIKETDLTKKIVSIPMLRSTMDVKLSHQIATEKKSVTMSQFSQRSKYSSRSKTEARHCISPSSSSEESTTKSTQTIVTLKKAVSIASDSDSEGIRIVQPNPLDDSDSHIPLQLKKPHEVLRPIAGTSRITANEVDSFVLSTTSQRSTTSEDYEADTDENFTISLPNLKYKHTSVEELNTQEEIDKIETNVQENSKLCDSCNKIIIRTDMSYELTMDDSSSFMSTQSSLLLTEDDVEITTKKKGGSKVSLP